MYIGYILTPLYLGLSLTSPIVLVIL